MPKEKSKKPKSVRNAEACISPVVDTVTGVLNSNADLNADATTLHDLVTHEMEKVERGDLSSMERMLTGQTLVLQSFFAKCINCAGASEYGTQREHFARLALKAQNQCRQTVIALAEIKRPKTHITNNAHNQQVNIGTEKNKNPANELLCEGNDATMDTRGTATPSNANPPMETVGA